MCLDNLTASQTSTQTDSFGRGVDFVRLNIKRKPRKKILDGFYHNAMWRKKSIILRAAQMGEKCMCVGEGGGEGKRKCERWSSKLDWHNVWHEYTWASLKAMVICGFSSIPYMHAKFYSPLVNGAHHGVESRKSPFSALLHAVFSL